jgi:hypothetical protein
MKVAYILVESHHHIEILQKLLPKHLIQDVKFIAGESSYRTSSLPTSLLATRSTSVLLVLDANNQVEKIEKAGLIKYLFNQVSSGIPSQVSLAVPQIEIVFLQDKSLIEKIAKRQFNDLEWQLAQSKPKEFLETVLGTDKPIYATIFTSINDEEIKIFQQHPLMQEIVDFLLSLTPVTTA